ncbi:MAG: glutathione S-transferase [Hyphomonadaceae bacterium]|nr:MAG: glutathione S-transferase [Hyphomonadaceae bacterium]KAF0186958.1 MAG: glutathione S-transferase [Hyphomonadaceae bacterium]
MTKPILFLGNRTYSSWSMRPWFALKYSGLDFDEIDVELDADGYGQAQVQAALAASPTGRVPALHMGELKLWDSLAICEWANEQAPSANLWPKDVGARALARAVVCEMHSGFGEIRNNLTCNIRRKVQEQNWNAATLSEMERLDDIWSGLLAQFGGPYLFGEKPTIADAFYIPMATRMRTYSVSLSTEAASYRDFILATPEFLEWEAAAAKQWKPFTRAAHDTVYD